jgi:cytochrome P450
MKANRDVIMTTAGTDVGFLDVLDPAFRPDSPAVVAARTAHWYARTPLGYAVLRYEQAAALLTDRRLREGGMDSLIALGITDGPLFDWMTSLILNVEGADHARLRRLVAKAFTRNTIEALRPVMRTVAAELVDSFAAAGRCEFMAAFADPYPARVICELLGIPVEHHEDFRGWANDLGLAFSQAVAAHRERIETALAGLYAAVDALIGQRRTAPRSDLLSALVTAEVAADRLSAEELRSMVAGLLFAGQDTTCHQLGLAVATFLDHPDQWRLLAAQPLLAARAVEEVMRIAPTVPGIWRLATEDFSYQGLELPAGTLLTVLVAAAQTDPAAFGGDGAARFDITASRPAQLTFGGGAHYCLGSALARAELAEALPILAVRLPALVPDGRPAWRPALGITGPVTLPIRFTPTSNPISSRSSRPPAGPRASS